MIIIDGLTSNPINSKQYEKLEKIQAALKEIDPDVELRNIMIDKGITETDDEFRIQLIINASKQTIKDFEPLYRIVDFDTGEDIEL